MFVVAFVSVAGPIMTRLIMFTSVRLPLSV